MARAEQVKLYRSFVKGLITEASYLTYPEDASTDELNTVPSRKGNRTRRLGIDYETGYTLQPVTLVDTDVINEFVWKSADQNPLKTFLCVQTGTTILFFDLFGEAISPSLKSFSLDLFDFAAPGASQAQIGSADCQFTSGKGFLFIANPYTEPLVVEYLPDTDTISAVPILILVRDFEGVNDGLANDEEPVTLSNEHKYNLMNQGWVTPGQYTVPGGVTIDTPPVWYDPYSGQGQFYGLLNIP
jgi:hypothetical protein